MGPYVIHDLSVSGAIHLATLDGEPMANWISGCRLKKYYKPLTEDILSRLHAAKERKQRKETIKQQAQTKAKERAAKLRRARAGNHGIASLTKKPQICAMREVDSISPAIRPFILVEIDTKFRTEYALFDTGADVNSLSHESWEVIGKPTLVPSTTILTSFIGESTPVKGYLDLPIFIGNTNVHHRFYVIKPGKLTSLVILGQSWQHTYNGIPNWRREGINFEIDSVRLFTPFMEEESVSLNSEEDQAKAITSTPEVPEECQEPKQKKQPI